MLHFSNPAYDTVPCHDTTITNYHNKIIINHYEGKWGKAARVDKTTVKLSKVILSKTATPLKPDPVASAAGEVRARVSSPAARFKSLVSLRYANDSQKSGSFWTNGISKTQILDYIYEINITY